MLAIFDYSFMQRAFLAGLAIGVIAPLIGTFLVAKRYSLIADSLAHVSLAGVGWACSWASARCSARWRWLLLRRFS
jgi:zinc transport system permease protein